jgi:hypothetical protein
LDRVEYALLSAGVVRPLRAAVLRQVKDQVLQDIPAGATPEQTAATLERLGISGKAPAAGASPTPAPLGREWRRYLKSFLPRRSRCAIWGTLFVLLLLVPLAAIFVVLSALAPHGLQVENTLPHEQVHATIGIGGVDRFTLFRADTPEGHIVATLSAATPFARFLWLFAPLAPFALAATLLGAGGLVDILRSRGRVTGLGLALFALLFFPVLLAIVAAWSAL